MKVLATYPSSSGSSIHEVRIGDDGVVYCTCPGWRFHNKRWCKHLEDYNEQVNQAFEEKDSVIAGQVAMREFKEAVVNQMPVEIVTQQVIDELRGAGYGR